MLNVKQGDRFPDVETTVKNELGVVVDLTAADVKFSMRKARAPTTIIINQVAGALVNGPLGQIAYRWQAGDTNVAGTYEGEFLVTPAGGGDPFKVPTDGYIGIVIEEKVA